MNKPVTGFAVKINPCPLLIPSPTRSGGRIRLRVYERGAGETLACGTGACAAVAVGIRRGLLDRSVRVSMRGGDLTIRWEGGDNPVWMTGPAVAVFEGEIEIDES